MKTHKGYCLVYTPGHPRTQSAGSTNKRSYVYEHILVMERELGRYLLPGENVHHKNGVKDDNRIENLELWTKPQPSGIRAEDAIGWTIEILIRHAPEALANRDSGLVTC